MKKRVIKLTNQQIAQNITRNYPEDICLVLWGDDEMEVHRFDTEKKAKNYQAQILKDENYTSYFVILAKNGKYIPNDFI